VLVDTHCHLTDPAFAADRDDVLRRMSAAGVERAVVIESQLTQLGDTLAWAAGRGDVVVAAGCHPHDASRWNAESRDALRDAWRHPVMRAVGEIGLDYHYDHSPRAVQRQCFAEQLAIAVDLGLPVVIHAREADEDIAAILLEQPEATVVLHSFSSGAALRDTGLERGWYFSFSGMVTFRTWNQTDTVRAVPAARVLVETDAPYLAPVPHRGKRNEPAFVVDTARRVAELRGATFEEVATSTSDNALRLFWSGRNPTSSART